MKKIFRRIALLGAALALLGGATSCKEDIISTIVNNADNSKTGDVKVGDELPNFGSVTLTTGRSFSKSSLKGKVSLLAFYSLDCSDCQEELPVLQEVYDYILLNGISSDYNFYTVSRDDKKADIEEYWDENSFSMPTAEDGLAYYYFASSGVPRIYISDKENIVTHIFTDKNMPSYKELLTALGLSTGSSDDDDDDEGWSDDSGNGDSDVEFGSDDSTDVGNDADKDDGSGDGADDGTEDLGDDDTDWPDEDGSDDEE